MKSTEDYHVSPQFGTYTQKCPYKEDAKKWKKNVSGKLVAFAVDINDNYAMTKDLWDICQNNIKIVEQLKKLKKRLQDKGEKNMNPDAKDIKWEIESMLNNDTEILGD